MDPSNTWQTPLISVVVPLFNEESNLSELHRRLVTTLEDGGHDFELVFVNDGSRDATARLLDDLHASDPRVMVVSLSRNFGHQAALSAGIDHASGQAVILMDGDLQDPPEVLPRFIAAWKAGSEVVYAVRTKRKEGLFKRGAYAMFYRLLRAVSEIDMPLDAGDFCLMDRKVVDALCALPERGRFVRGLRAFVGFKQIGLEYERDARQAGASKYSLAALCQLALDGVTSFSGAPLSAVSWLGGLLLMLSLVLGVGSLLTSAMAGWWVVTVVVIGCTGLQLVGMGVVGAYVHRIFVESKGRPTYIVAALKQPAINVQWQEADVS